MSSGISRRGLFSLFGRSLRGPAKATRSVVETVVGQLGATAPPTEPPAVVAVIQGRYCLAYTSSCTVCAERCPVPGAILVEQGIPRVEPDTCTGCGVCHEVCPAPTNAVLVIPRRLTPGLTPPPPAAA